MTLYVRLSQLDPPVLGEGPCPAPHHYRNVSGFHHLSREEQATYGWYPFVVEPEPAWDPRQQRMTRHLVLEDGVAYSRPVVDALDEVQCQQAIADLRRERIASLAEIRWRHEVGGATALGIPFRTDRESHSTLALAAIEERSINWKAADGEWHVLSGEMLADIVHELRQFRQACFDHEAALTQRLYQAETIEELEAVRLEEGWP